MNVKLKATQGYVNQKCLCVFDFNETSYRYIDHYNDIRFYMYKLGLFFYFKVAISILKSADPIQIIIALTPAIM